MAQQDKGAQEHVNGVSTEAEQKPRVAPTTPSSNPDSMLQSTIERPSSSPATASPTSAGENGATPNDRYDQPESIGDPKAPLEGFDWEDLEKRYQGKMEECRETENEIYEEFGRWVRVCSFPPA